MSKINSKKNNKSTLKIRGFEVVSDTHRQHSDMEIKTPIRADSGSCAYDFFSPVDFEIYPDETFLVWTDIKAYMQPSECLEINVRSSIGRKKKCVLVNTIGWIDATYYNNPDNDGNIGICLLNKSKKIQTFKKGERIAQGKFGVFLTADVDEVLKETRDGGYGSSGE